MSPIIDINLDETPDEMPQIATGVRILEIRDIEDQEDINGDTVHIVKLSVAEPDADDNELQTWERFNFKYPIARVRFKKLCLAAGHEGGSGGVDPADLIGCTLRASIVPNTYTDKDSGEMKTNTKVKEFLRAGD